jgi:hypothetical protein
MLSTSLRTVAVVCLLALASPAVADDSFYRVRLDDLQFADGAKLRPATPHWEWLGRWSTVLPYAILDGGGDAYVNPSEYYHGPTIVQSGDAGETIFVRTPRAGDVTGRLYYPKPDASGMDVLQFTIPAAKAGADARAAFYQARKTHYDRLLSSGAPGGAWFRHQIRQMQLELHETPTDAATAAPRVWQRDHHGDVIDTYALFTGGRAVSENLQLDRVMRGTKPAEATIDIDSLEGITVHEIDWTPLVKDLHPKLDPLAASIPADQHVVFFQTFQAAVETADQADVQGTPILHLAEPRSEDAGTVHRYQRQLCLSMTGLGRLLGPKVIKSLALTGSDPYFRVGTDVAVLFEAVDPAMLEKLLLVQISMGASQTPTAAPQHGDIDGVKYRGVRSPDRAVCSYVARLDGAVVVTNSLYQLQRLVSVAQKKTPAVASLPEYTFFRNRYKLGDPDETALVFLSDATIRRWCGPRWRIATSRQTRDLAVLAELHAAHLDPLVKGTVKPGPIYTDFATADIGELSLDPSGVRSSVQGSLEFMTPIGELPMQKVTQAEADAYRVWRDGYQRNWSWAFDPIALRLALHKDRLAGDITVMPLIFATEYREFQEISGGAKFAPDAGDRHDALFHLIVAVNTKSPMFQRTENFLSSMSHGVTLGWLGPSVAIYADDDPVWREIAQLKTHNMQFLEDNLHRLPIAVRAEVSNGFRLAAFLAAARAYIEQTAPGMVAWESLTYKDQPYVKVTATDRAKGQMRETAKMAIYYAASGDALVVTLREDVLKRSIDRQLARAENVAATLRVPSAGSEDIGKSSPTGTRSVPSTSPWLGENVALRVDRKAFDALGVIERLVSSEDRQVAVQKLAWANLPILNEWKRLYPDCDPVELHQRVWKIRLVCPGGGKYVWNEKYQTMESTVYGHPGEPKTGPDVTAALRQFSSGDFGLTFEHQGLRARASLQRDTAKPKEQ